MLVFKHSYISLVDFTYNVSMDQSFLNLEASKISVAEKLILENVRINLAPGDSLGVLGNNGSGKTTLLKAISKQANKKILGYAPDTPPLYSNDTILQYLEFIANLKKIPRAYQPSRIKFVLEMFNLERYKNDDIITLSKGNRQKLNLAQAIIAEPSVLILDEPSNALDQEQIKSFRQYLYTLKAKGVALVIATHHMTDITPLCNKTLMIKDKHLETYNPT